GIAAYLTTPTAPCGCSLPSSSGGEIPRIDASVPVSYFAQRKPMVEARRSGSLKSRVSTVLTSEGPPIVLGGSSSQPAPRTLLYRPVSGPRGFCFGMNG